jgi:hypothetical protein
MAFFCAEVNSFLGLFFRVPGLGILVRPNTKFERPKYFHLSKTYEYIRREIYRKQGISR